MLIFAACLAVFVYGMVASMLGTINPGLAEKLQLNNVQTGYMALAQGIGLTIASVSVGPLIDRRGRVRRPRAGATGSGAHRERQRGPRRPRRR